MASPQPQYSPKQVAEALCVSESSVKRWCDRGAVPTVRTLGGHRRVTLDGLNQFLNQTGRELSNPEVLGLPSFPRLSRRYVPGNDDSVYAAFREALCLGQEATCRHILQERIACGWTPTEAAENLITDAMCSIGEAWKCGQLDVYQERRGCDIALRLVNELRASLPRLAPNAPVAIGGSPEGDPYQLPTALVELALRQVGWQATSLGSNVPIESFRQATHDCSPRLVWLSVSTVADPIEFVSQVNEFADRLGENVPLLVGGRGLDDVIRPRLRYTAHCDNLKHLVDLAAMMKSNLAWNVAAS